MNTGTEFGQYFCANTEFKKHSEDAVRLNPLTSILGTPVGFTLSRQKEIRGSNRDKMRSS